MQLSLKSLTAAAAVALALGSTSAMAVESVTTGNSSLIVIAYDPVLGISVAQDLGLNYADFLEAAVTPDEGLTLNFDVDLSVFGSNLGDVRYSVFAGDASGGAATTEVLITAGVGAGTIPGQNSNVVSMLGSGGSVGVYTAWNTFCGSSTLTCTGTNFGSTYFGGFAEDANNQLLAPGGANAALDSALGFYSLRRSSPGAGDPLISAQYANANGLATWLLNADGTLTYNVPAVPLPAALWLLLSGMAGLGVVGRRKASA